MKRFASHYLYVPGRGFLKQQVVELNEEGFVTGLFPLQQELESVSWLPGVIVLSGEAPDHLRAHHLYPFDFRKMEPMGSSQKRMLP